MDNFKIIKHLKTNWLKNASEHGGAMQLVIDSKSTNNVIWSKTRKYGNMWADVNDNELLKLTTKDNSIYEVICSFPHKIYFDIDGDNKDYNIYEKIVPKINELFPDADMAVSGSKSDVRQSYHIVLNNYLINSEEDRQRMKSLAKYLKLNFDDGFDDKVYTKNRNMKCINQSKEDGRIQAIVLNKDVKKHFITTFIQSKYELPKFEITQPEIKLAIDIDEVKSKKFNIGELPKLKLVLPQTIKFNINDFKPIEALKILPINKSFDHKYTHFIARYCFYSGLSFEEFISWYQNKNNSNDAVNKWRYHWGNLDKYPIVNSNQIMTLILKYYPSIKKDKHFLNFQNLFKLDNVQKVDALNQDLFQQDSKFLCINTGMGSGKTYQTIKYLQDKNDFIWITPNIALAQNTTQRLRTDGIDISYYKDLKNPIDKMEHMKDQDKLIICLNSLHYTDERKYKIVVIDEIETLLNKWFNNKTLNDSYALKLANWQRFLDIIKNADKVILLDAFTSKLTIDFINSVETIKNNYNIIELKENNVNRKIFLKSSFESWVNSIIETLKENKKAFIFYPFKEGSSNYISMENLKALFEKETNKKGICYHGECDDKILKTLDDVNKHWNEVDFVMTNNKISVGLNYELSDFDSVFVSIAKFSSPRDIIQVSYRCRQLKSNNIYVSYLNTRSTNNVMKNDVEIVLNCPIYTELTKNIVLEKISPLKTTFDYFCKLANYKMNYSKELINKSIDTSIKTLLDDVELGYSYETIKDITSNELKELGIKLINMDSTMDEKIMIRKYFYKSQFKTSLFNENLQIGWNEKYVNFFTQTKKLIIEPNNLFNKIKDFNKWSSIFPSDEQMNKVKLNDELIEQVFKEYHFKDLNKKSKPTNLIKNIYNNYFEKTVIKSEADENKHCKLSISDKVHQLYNFACTNLRIYKSLVDLNPNSLLDGGVELETEPEKIHYKPKSTENDLFID